MSKYSDINKKLILNKKWKYYLQLSESWSISIYKNNWDNVSKNIELKWNDVFDIQRRLDSYYFDDPLTYLKAIITEASSKQMLLFWDSEWLEIEDWYDASFYEIDSSKEELIEWLLQQIKEIVDNNSLTKWRFQFYLSENWFLKKFNEWKKKKLEVELTTSYKKNFNFQLRADSHRTNWYSSNYMYKLQWKYWDFDFFEKVWKNLETQNDLIEDINVYLYELVNLYSWLNEE